MCVPPPSYRNNWAVSRYEPRLLDMAPDHSASSVISSSQHAGPLIFTSVTWLARLYVWKNVFRSLGFGPLFPMTAMDSLGGVPLGLWVGLQQWPSPWRAARS